MGIKTLDDIFNETDMVIILEAASVGIYNPSTFCDIADRLNISDDYLISLGSKLNFVLHGEE